MTMKTVQTNQDIKQGLLALSKLDPKLSSIIKIAGDVPLRREEGGFAGLARIIIGQHVSTASAAAIHGRFIKHIKPVTCEAYLNTPEEILVTIGLTRAKQSTLTIVAMAILDGKLDLDALHKLDAQEAIAKLTALKGIGPWTAEIYLLFCIGHPDIFAAGDLAIREAYRHAYDLEERPSEKQLRQLASKWSPHKAIATRLFWSYYEKIKGRETGTPL